MIGWMIRSALWALSLAALAYVVVFVPVGHHTLYRHGARIASTPAARELGDALSELVAEARRVVMREAVARTP